MPTRLPKRYFTYTVKDFYRVHKKRSKQAAPKKQVWDYKTYKAVMSDMYLALAEKMIKNNYLFIIPFRLGRLFLKEKQYKTAGSGGFDYHKSNTIGRMVKYISSTYGKVGFMVWNKKGTSFKNKTFYLFKAVDSQKAKQAGVGKRGITDLFKEKYG